MSLAWFRRLRSRPLAHTPRAACPAGRAGVGWRSIGRSPTAISVKNNGGGHRRGRPILVGRAMTVTDDAAALFFRAVARDRHLTHACTACRTLRGYESALKGVGLTRLLGDSFPYQAARRVTECGCQYSMTRSRISSSCTFGLYPTRR